MRRSAVAALSLAVVGVLALAGCASDKPKSAAPTKSVEVGTISKDAAAAGLLPDKIKSAGKLQVGINVSYAPNEYKDPSGKIVGWEVDFLDGVAKKLGLATSYQETALDTIIPGVAGAKYDVGMSSFTDNKKREQQVDFVNYYSAGFQWASPAGKTVDPNNACGLKVIVQTGTTEETEGIPAKSKACTDAGKPAITMSRLDSHDAKNQAVVLGQYDALDADSPITQYAVKQSNGKLQLAGDLYSAAPYGLAVAKGAGTLKEALQKAIQSMIDDGSYRKILETWGVEPGAIATASINGATS
jgi:polar amino acid transport system substrate-binding protein